MSRYALFLLVSVGVACGSSNDDEGTGNGAGGNRADGGDGAASSSSSSGGSSGTIDGAARPDVVTGTNPSKLAVDLASAAGFVIIAKSAISTVPTSAITGNLALSPAAASYVTGFDLTADSTNVFATSPQVTGRLYAADYASPTPSNLTAAVGAMETAFTDAAGRAPDVTELGAGDIGGKTLTKGVYKWSTGLLVPTDITLTGSATDVWIMQVAQGLTVANDVKVTLAGGALAKNVFWQVSGAVDLGTTSRFEGIVLGQTAIALHTGARIHGRLFAQTAVTLESSTVEEPQQ